MKGKSIFYRWLGAHFLAVRCGCYGVHVVFTWDQAVPDRGEHYRK